MKSFLTWITLSVLLSATMIAQPVNTNVGGLPSYSRLYAPDGTAALPSIAFNIQKNMGFYRSGSNQFCGAAAATSVLCYNTNAVTAQNGIGLGFAAGTGAADTVFWRTGAGALALGSGTPSSKTGTLTLTALISASTQPALSSAIRLGNNEGIGWRNAANSTDIGIFLDGTNTFQVQAPTNFNSNLIGGIANINADAGASYGWNARSLIKSPANAQVTMTNAAATSGVGFDLSTDGGLQVRDRAVSGGSGFVSTGTLIANSTLNVQGSQITAGTDVTVTNPGDVTIARYQATITPASGGATNCATQAAGFKAAALTADCVIATIPAGSKIIGAYADVTAGFTCSGTCTGTKTFSLGISAGGVEIFAAGLSVTALARFGLLDADMGTQMTRAAAIQGGYLPSWTGTTTITARFTSGTGNWGNASVTFVNAGSIKFTVLTQLVK
jgi:hypothetical protein